MIGKCLSLILILFSSIALGSTPTENVIRICLSRVAQEYDIYLEKIGAPSPAKKFIASIAKDLNYETKFEYLEANRCFKYAKEGEFEGVLPINDQSKTLDFLSYPKKPNGTLDTATSIYPVDWNVYALKDAKTKSSIKTIKDIPDPIGVYFDSSIKSVLENEGVNLESTAKNSESLLRQLLTNRVNTIILSNYEFLKAKADFKNIEMDKVQLLFTYKIDPMYFVFTKKFTDKNPKLVKKFYNLIPIKKKKKSFQKEYDLLQKALK